MAFDRAVQDRFSLPIVFAFRLAGPEDLSLGAIAGAIEQVKCAARVGRAQIIHAPAGEVHYELEVFTAGDEHAAAIRKALSSLDGVKVLDVLDMSLETHRGGACEMRSRRPIKSNTDLRMVYTPGVARVCKAIQKDPACAREFTNIANKVAIATNGTAILGLGDIGCLSGLPVMEGKSAIFWEFAGISAEPVLIDTHDADEFIRIVEALACGFGAIQIEDVAAPDCFKITRELDRRLGIPVMHDDQHGTATIVLAGLFSALKKTGRRIGEINCVMSGAGAAGTAIADLLLGQGAADVVLCDRTGAIHRGRAEGMNAEKNALAGRTNKGGFKGTLAQAMKGRNLFIGVSQANIVKPDMVRSMAKDPIVFALANPVSEIGRADAMSGGAAIYADGRIMNNAIAYPGIFRGALDCRSKMITVQMVVAAAQALAESVKGDDLLPEMMDPATHQTVAQAVMRTAGPGDELVR
ncbi:MAG: NAD-dependent malic enzyme [Planctomycetes bacterium]|nr:NAD-dependent malic enzyme [Planctomycetota bacterium]